MAAGRLSRRALVLALVGAVVASCSSAPSERARPAIGFILIGDRDDLGYNQAVYEGSVAVARAFPDNPVLRTYGVPERPAAVEAMESLIRQGARVVFATSFGHLDAAREVARRHPEVIVVHQGGVEGERPLPNLGTYFGTMYEPVFQAGIAAGAVTVTKRLGFVAAFPIPATYNNVNAFLLGARTVDPAVTVSVVFTGAWCDPDLQAAAARRLLAEGVDVLGQHQDCTRSVLEAAERAGASSVGYHYDASESAPRSWLVGAVWDWGPLFVDIARTALAGRFVGSPYDADFRGGFATGDNPFVLTEFGPRVPASAQLAIEAAGRRLRAGGSPFEGPLFDRDGTLRVPAGVVPARSVVDSMSYFVPGVVGQAPG